MEEFIKTLPWYTTYSLTFLSGAIIGATGGYYGNLFTDKRREKEFVSLELTKYQTLRDAHFPLFKEMKESLLDPQLKNIRRFYLTSSRYMLNTNGPAMVFYLDKHENLEGQINILEEAQYLTEVTEFGKNTKQYQISEKLVQHIFADNKLN